MALTDEQRGPRAAWLRRHRVARYGTGTGGLEKLSEALRAEGVYRSPDTIKGWESSDERSPIPPDVLPALESLFHEDAPRPFVAPTTSDLVAALGRQTEALQAQTQAINALVATLGGTPSGDVDAVIERLVDRYMSRRRDPDPVPSGER